MSLLNYMDPKANLNLSLTNPKHHQTRLKQRNVRKCKSFSKSFNCEKRGNFQIPPLRFTPATLRENV